MALIHVIKRFMQASAIIRSKYQNHSDFPFVDKIAHS